ncbi:Nudix hydrolase domain-containing protein [Frankia sp. AiPs1]|uniref:NUDIX hydrolase n=1 Tax=Frankia sp. AiPa1 TaxID=573492 RepID=UPI0027E5AD54|nr:NUDIX hydrolase [Frankia sp. AiPa1]
MQVVRRAARAILIDGNGRLILFRRTLPKRKPYWSTPGGGVDDEDASVEAALHRELAEELGAVVDRVQPVFLTSPPRGAGIAVSHFFVCRLVSMNLSQRTGEEFSNPAKGRYDVERIDLRGKRLSRYDLQPAEIKTFILANRQALLLAALDDAAPPLITIAAADDTPAFPSTVTSAEAPTDAGQPADDHPTSPLDLTTTTTEPATAEPATTEPALAEPPTAKSATAGPGTVSGDAKSSGACHTPGTSQAPPSERTSPRTPPSEPTGHRTAPSDRPRVPRAPAPAPATPPGVGVSTGPGSAGPTAAPKPAAPTSAAPGSRAASAPGSEPSPRRRAVPAPMLEIVDGETVKHGTAPVGEGTPRTAATARRRWWRRGSDRT